MTPEELRQKAAEAALEVVAALDINYYDGAAFIQAIAPIYEAVIAEKDAEVAVWIEAVQDDLSRMSGSLKRLRQASCTDPNRGLKAKP